MNRQTTCCWSITMLHTILGIACTIVLSLSAPLQAEGDASDHLIVKPYLQGATMHEIVVLWRTADPATTRLEYGLAQLDADEPNLDQATELDGTRTMHEVRLQGLEPGSVYLYRVVSTFSSGDVYQSEVYTFETAPNDPNTPIAFAVFSDTQDNPKVWGHIAEQAWRERPDFAIHAGDIVGTGSDDRHWTHDFLAPGQKFMARFPIYTALGNHEGDAENYYRYMANPEPEYFYKMDYGNARFFFIDTNREVTEDSPQYYWLESQLSTSTARWNFVVHHHPVYSSDETDYGDAYIGLHYQGDLDIRHMRKLYEKFGVDVVFYGHIHDYERTWPVRGDQLDHENGTVYVQVGGCGGSLEDFAPYRSWFTAKVFRGHFFAMTTIAGDILNFRVIDVDGRRIDEFTIDKRNKPSREAFLAKSMPARPVFSPRPTAFKDQIDITLAAARPDQVIRYTLDGMSPTEDSPIYDSPITLTDDATIIAAAFDGQGQRSADNQSDYRKLKSVASVSVDHIEHGLEYTYYEGRWRMLPDFGQLQAIRSGVVERPGIESIKPRDDHWAVVFNGYIKLDEAGVYEFEVTSDDGSRMYIHDLELVNNDGSHSPRVRSGQVALDVGYHPIRIEYFEDYMGEVLSLRWRRPGEDFPTSTPSSVFYHTVGN